MWAKIPELPKAPFNPVPKDYFFAPPMHVMGRYFDGHCKIPDGFG